MQEIRNNAGKLICLIDNKSKTVEIVLKGNKTMIQFLVNGKVNIVNI